MVRLVVALAICAGAIVAVPGTVAFAATVGISWAGFQAARWGIDHAAIRAALDTAGISYLNLDAEGSTEKQIEDIRRLVAADVDALIVIATEAEALKTVVADAVQSGIPVVAYDRLIDNPLVVYVSFDSMAVGRLQAQALMQQKPRGRYVLLKGPETDPNSARILAGQLEVLADALASGAIVNVGEAVAENWSAESAYEEMSRILDETGGGVDAVLAANDTLAGGAILALEERGLAGTVAVSGQDGSPAALNRIARGTQTMTVWKDSRLLGKRAGEVAAFLVGGGQASAIPDAILYRPPSANWEVNAVFLPPHLITQGNLDIVISAGWAAKSAVCRGVDPQIVPACAGD